MKYTICIVEDKKIEGEILTLILTRYFHSKHIDFELKYYDTGREFYADYQEGYIHPDILLIDIFLPYSNGLEICRNLRKNGFAGDIIITTETNDYAVDAFDVDARGYFLKPYDAEKIYATLDRLVRYSAIRTLTIRPRRQVIKIPTADIFYIESQNRSCIIHCGNDITYMIYKKLDDLEKELDDIHFLRCHKSYLVNMDYITQVSDCFTLSSGAIIPIRKSDCKTMKQKYDEFSSTFK